MKFSWADFDTASHALAVRLKDALNLDGWAIYGEPRGGLPLAVSLSHHLRMPLVDEPTSKTVWVDDRISTGETLSQRLMDYALDDPKGTLFPVVWVDQRRRRDPHVLSVLQASSHEELAFPWEAGSSERGPGLDCYRVSSLSHTLVLAGSLSGRRVSVLKLGRYGQAMDSALIESHLIDASEWVIIHDSGNHDLKRVVDMIQKTGRKVALQTSALSTHGLGLGDKLIVTISKEKHKLAVPILSAADEIQQAVAGPHQIQRLESVIQNVSLKPSCEIYLLPQVNHSRIIDLCYNAQKIYGWKISPKVRFGISEYAIEESK